MYKQKITNLINQAHKIEVMTLSSVADNHQIEKIIRTLRDNFKKNSGKESILIQVIQSK